MQRDLDLLQKKVTELEMNLKKERDGRRKEKLQNDEAMKRLQSSVQLISGKSNLNTSNRGSGDSNSRRVAELEASHKTEKKQNAKLKEVVQELKLQVEELAVQRDDLADKNEKNQAIDNQSRKWRKQCDDLRDLNEDLRHQIDDLKEEWDYDKIGQNKEKKKLEDRMRELEHKAVSSEAALKKEVEAHAETREFLKNAAKAGDKKSSTADKSKIQNQQTEIRKLNQKERRQHAEIEQLKKDLAELNEDYTAMSLEVQKNDQELKKNRTLGRQLRDQEEIVKQMTDDIESKGKDLKEKDSQIESLQQKLKEKGNQSMSNVTDEKECECCFEPFSEDRRAMCFFPCGHAHTCQSCLQKGGLKNCPTCRVKIQKSVVLFY